MPNVSNIKTTTKSFEKISIILRSDVSQDTQILMRFEIY